MEDRIEINGEWYIKEKKDTITDKNTVNLDATEFKGRVYESDLYCFEVTKLHKDDGTLYPGCSIEFTDKRVKPFKNEFWDNENWFLGVLDENPASMESIEDMCCEQGVREFKHILNNLVKDGWLVWH